MTAQATTRRPKLTAWERERRKRDKYDSAKWADALRNAGDYSGYTFSLGHNPAVYFIDQLTHTGDYAAQSFELQLWQEAILRLMFDQEGLNRYRYVFIGLPRKNGKTELVAAIVLYLMAGTGIRSQNIYSASGDAEQAALIHRAAASMVHQNEKLSEVCNVYKGNVKRITLEPLGSEYKALSSDAELKFGLRPSVNVFDEVHVFPNRDLHAALETAFGATKRPFTIYISTAGWDRTSLCYELWDRARHAMRDPKSDPRFLGILYEFHDDEDNWQDEKVWHRINPGLGTFCNLDNFRHDMEHAAKFPGYENECKQFYLNQWTEQQERWISRDEWQQCIGHVNPAEMVGEPCYAGFDGSKTGDMTALWLIWPTPKGIKCAGRCWAPREGKWRDELRNKDRYEKWSKPDADGAVYLHLTKDDTAATGLDNAINEAQIEREIVELNEKFPMISLFADRAYFQQMLTRLFNEAGIPVKAIPQTCMHLNEPCVTLERMILDRSIEHGGNPILDWNVANASIVRNTTGLIHPNKTSATERIDGLAALLNALAGYIDDEADRSASVYERPGMLAL